MSDPFKKVRTGDPLRVPATTWNAFIDAAQYVRKQQNINGGIVRDSSKETGIILVRNSSGQDLERFNILGVDGPLIDESENADEFAKRVAFDGSIPTEDDHEGKFAILLEPVANGAIRLACMDGLCTVKVEMADENDRYADVNDGVPSRLLSGSTGSAYLLWIQPQAQREVSNIAWTIARVGVPQATALRYLLAQITAHRGTGGNVTYDATAIDVPFITVTNKRPLFRPFGPEIEVTPALNGKPCLLLRDVDDSWKIGAVAEEVVPTNACAPQAGAGTRNIQYVPSITYSFRDGSKPNVSFPFNVPMNVAASTQNQYGALLFTFPAGRIGIRYTLLDATVSAPTITQKIKLALGTSDASGQAGTSFGASFEDISLNAGQSVNLSATGAAYVRPNPDPANAVNDLTNVYPMRNGSVTPVPVYLNLCQTKAGGWDASDTVRLQGTLSIDFINMGDAD